MKESTLNRLCLIGAVSGIIILYAYSVTFTQQEMMIKDITSGMSGSRVNLTGQTEKVYFHKDGHIFFTLSDGTGSMRVVVWRDAAKQMELEGRQRIRNNMTLNVEGILEDYKGELELIPSAKGIKLLT